MAFCGIINVFLVLRVGWLEGRLRSIEESLFVSEEVINKSSQIDLKAEPEDKSEKGKKWQEILENLNPEDFGKYKM